MDFDDTPGGAATNSFADVEYFRAYHETRYPQIEWVVDSLDAVVKALLVMAGRGLNHNFPWTGVATDGVQAMTWPRRGMLTRNGYAIASTVIPDDLKNAQCELAGQMGDTDLVADNDAAKQGISSVKAGSVSVSFFRSLDPASEVSMDMALRLMGSQFNYLSSEVPGEVRRLLVPSWFSQPTIKRPLFFEAF